MTHNIENRFSGPHNSFPDISIVIVSWNAKNHLDKCLASLRLANGELLLEVIVVDNASDDGTRDLIRRQYPDVKLVENCTNVGFARGNNIGIKRAGGKYLCLINPDVIVSPDCLEKMHRFMEQNPDIGLLGPKMLAPDGRVRRSGMRFPTLWNTFLRASAADSLLRGRAVQRSWLMNDFHFDEVRDIEVLNGWFWMARRNAVSKVGSLDERFFMYAEDIDWCKRFHSAGWRVVFYPKAQAVHYGGGSSSNAPVRFSIERQRANFQYWRKYHNRFSLFFYALAICLHHALRMMGWGSVSLVKRSLRPSSLFKVKVHLACFYRLLGSHALNKAQE